MTVDRKTCRMVGERRRWDAWLAGGLPAEVRSHAADCTRCGPVIATLDRMGAGLAVIATEPPAAGVDLADTVLRALDREAAPAPRRPWLPRLALATGALAVGVALWAIVASPPAAGATARLDVPSGASLISGDITRTVSGLDLALELPATLRTAATQAAVVRLGADQIEIWPRSDVRVAAPLAVALEAGGVAVSSATELHLDAGRAEVRGVGRLSLELASSTQEHPMKILTRHKVTAGAGAVLAIAVYSGWATLSTPGTSLRIEGPGGALIDADGRARRFPLAVATDEAAGDRTSGAAAAGTVTIAAGAFWDEDTQLVQFSIPGEIFDADTGQPLDAFEIVAAADASLGYGQARPKTFAFDHGAGKFTLTGIGLGTWRLTARAAGYSPVTQTLGLDQLSADPYVMIPMSRGAQLSGRVVDWQGRPVAAAQVGLVECVAGADNARPLCPVAESKADGTFFLPALPEGEVFEIYARHPRFGYASRKNLRQAPASTEHVVIQLSGIVRIHGTVTRGAGRAPVAGAVVVAEDRRIVTDAGGGYELLVPLAESPTAWVERDPAAPDAKVKIQSFPDDRSAWALSWVDRPTHVAEVRIDFRLAMERARLFGQITDAGGQPIAGAELHLANTSGWARGRGHETYPTWTVTDATGRFAIENLPSHAGYQVSLEREGERRELGYVNIPEEAPVEANFQVGGGAIRGSFVTATDGQPLPLSARSCEQLGARRTGAGVDHYALPRCYPDGRFEFEELAAGTYTLEDRIPAMKSPIAIHPKSVSLAAGQIAEDVRVPVDGGGADTWKLRVLDRERRFVAGAYLRYHLDRASFTTNLHVDVDGTATISIDRIYPTIFIDSPGHVSAEIDLRGRDPAKIIEVHLARRP